MLFTIWCLLVWIVVFILLLIVLLNYTTLFWFLQQRRHCVSPVERQQEVSKAHQQSPPSSRACSHWQGLSETSAARSFTPEAKLMRYSSHTHETVICRNTLGFQQGGIHSSSLLNTEEWRHKLLLSSCFSDPFWPHFPLTLSRHFMDIVKCHRSKDIHPKLQALYKFKEVLSILNLWTTVKKWVSCAMLFTICCKGAWWLILVCALGRTSVYVCSANTPHM